MSIEKHSRPGWYYIKYYPGGRNEPLKRRVAEAVKLDSELKQGKAPIAKTTHPRLIDVVCGK
jgi:hypothetical protein